MGIVVLHWWWHGGQKLVIGIQRANASVQETQSEETKRTPQSSGRGKEVALSLSCLEPVQTYTRNALQSEESCLAPMHAYAKHLLL